jgi:hypothetical protein
VTFLFRLSRENWHMIVCNLQAGYVDRVDLRMPEERAAEYRKKAEECRQEAARAVNEIDRQNWLTMADEWMALARSAEETAALAESAQRRNENASKSGRNDS